MGLLWVQILIIVLPLTSTVNSWPQLNYFNNPNTEQYSPFFIGIPAPKYNPSGYFPGDIWNSPIETKRATQRFACTQRQGETTLDRNEGELISHGGRDYEIIEPLNQARERDEIYSDERANEKEANNWQSSNNEGEKQLEPSTTSPSPPPPLATATPQPFTYMPNPFIKSRSTYSADYIDLGNAQLDYPESLVNVPNHQSDGNRDVKSFIVIPEKDLIKLEATVKLPPGKTVEEHSEEHQPFHVLLPSASDPPLEKEPKRNETKSDGPRARSVDLEVQLCPLKKGEHDFINGQYVKFEGSKSSEPQQTSASSRQGRQGFKMAMIGNVPVRVKNQDVDEPKNVKFPIEIYSKKNVSFAHAHPLAQGRSSDPPMITPVYLTVNQEAYYPPYVNYGPFNKKATPSTFQTNIKNMEAFKPLDYNEEGIFSEEKMNQNSRADSKHIFNYPRFLHKSHEELSHPPTQEDLMYSKSLKSDASPISGVTVKTIYSRQPETAHESSIEWNSDKSKMKCHPLLPWLSIGTARGNSHYPPNRITLPVQMNALNHNKCSCPVPLGTFQKRVVDHDSIQNNAPSIPSIKPYFYY